MSKEADRDGTRTIGVLTKADCIQTGMQDEWMKVLTGARYPLKLGWYMVCNPKQKDLDDGIAFRDARMKEHKYFVGTEPWSQLYSATTGGGYRGA
jgi:hypothetical protein